MKDTVLLEEMTWPEVEAAIARGVRSVVVMTSSTEQHGPHLTLATDALSTRPWVSGWRSG